MQTALQEPPRWAWLAFPPMLIIVQYAIRYYDTAVYNLLFESEIGIVELATPAVLLVAIAAGGAALRYRGRFPGAWLKLWVPLVTLGCFYFAGEELSWGQQLFGWATPEYWNTINHQGETNLHNISSWFNQKPRLLLELWVLGGGVIYPLSRRHRQARVSDWGYWFWPTYVCFPAALLAILIGLPKLLDKWFGIGPLPLVIRYSEVQEYYFGVFLALYLISVWYRVRQLPADH